MGVGSGRASPSPSGAAEAILSPSATARTTWRRAGERIGGWRPGEAAEPAIRGPPPSRPSPVRRTWRKGTGSHPPRPRSAPSPPAPTPALRPRPGPAGKRSRTQRRRGAGNQGIAFPQPPRPTSPARRGRAVTGASGCPAVPTAAPPAPPPAQDGAAENVLGGGGRRHRAHAREPPLGGGGWRRPPVSPSAAGGGALEKGSGPALARPRGWMRLLGPGSPLALILRSSSQASPYKPLVRPLSTTTVNLAQDATVQGAAADSVLLLEILMPFENCREEAWACPVTAPQH